MNRLGALALGAGLLLAASGCDLGTGCPTTVDEAAERSFDDEIVGGGYVIRFIPSADPFFRSYDVNVTRPVSEHARMNTYLLRTRAEIPGIAPGDAVLLIAERGERAIVPVAGMCPPLTVTSDEDVSWEANQP